MVAVSKLLTACVALGSTVSWPLRINPLLMGNSNRISAPAARSEVSETPDTMWNGVDRIRRSDESIETPDTMWNGVDRIPRSEESASEESKATPDTMWNPRRSVESIDIPNAN